MCAFIAMHVPFTCMTVCGCMQVVIGLQERQLVVTAPLVMGAAMRKHRLVVPFRHLRGALLIDPGASTLTFTLRQPPECWRSSRSRL